MKKMLGQTKKYLKQHDYRYQKTYIRPLLFPDNVYVFHFGQKRLNNRLVIRYSHRWTGRQKINEIDLRLHKQKHPRVFINEAQLLNYLKTNLLAYEQKLKMENHSRSDKK